MLKLMVLLECDRCGESLRRVAVSSDRNPAAWDYLIGGLEFKATESYWAVDSLHFCNACLLELSGDFNCGSEQRGAIDSELPF